MDSALLPRAGRGVAPRTLPGASGFGEHSASGKVRDREPPSPALVYQCATQTNCDHTFPAKKYSRSGARFVLLEQVLEGGIISQPVVSGIKLEQLDREIARPGE